ncbi:hypothetical protein GGI35DRAFT_411479 [Trichoderma velutinum]
MSQSFGDNAAESKARHRSRRLGVFKNKSRLEICPPSAQTRFSFRLIRYVAPIGFLSLFSFFRPRHPKGMIPTAALTQRPPIRSKWCRVSRSLGACPLRIVSEARRGLHGVAHRPELYILRPAVAEAEAVTVVGAVVGHWVDGMTISGSERPFRLLKVWCWRSTCPVNMAAQARRALFCNYGDTKYAVGKADTGDTDLVGIPFNQS